MRRELLASQLVDHEASQNRASQHGSQQAQPAEEVHGTREVFGQKPDSQNIQQYIDRTAQTVVGLSRGAGYIVNRHFGHTGAIQAGECRDESM